LSMGVSKMIAGILGFALSLSAAPAAKSAADHIVIVADSRRFTGWEAWWTNVYNDSRMLFALVTIITVPAIALILGRLTSWVLARTGINLKSRELAEH